MRLVSCLFVAFVACCVRPLFLPFTCDFLTLFSLLSLLSFVISPSSLLPSHVLFWPFSLIFFQPLFLRSLLSRLPLIAYLHRGPWEICAPLSVSQFSGVIPDKICSIRKHHMVQRWQMGTGRQLRRALWFLAIKVLRSYEAQMKTLLTERLHGDSGESVFFLSIWLEFINKVW